MLNGYIIDSSLSQRKDKERDNRPFIHNKDKQLKEKTRPESTEKTLPKNDKE